MNRIDYLYLLAANLRDHDEHIRFTESTRAVLINGLDIYLVNVKTIRKIAQMFVAFLEKLNFTISSYHLVESAKTY